MLRCAACQGENPCVLDIEFMRVSLCRECLMLVSAWLVVAEHRNISPKNLYSIQLRLFGNDDFVFFGPSCEDMTSANMIYELFSTRIEAFRNSNYLAQSAIKERDGTSAR